MPPVAFSDKAVVDIDRGGIAFAVKSDERCVACFVSQEALCDLGASDIDGISLIGTFHARQRLIGSAVKDKIADGAFEPDGSVALHIVDLWM